MDEDGRLYNLFRCMSEELGFDDVELKVIAPKESDKSWVVNGAAGRTKWWLLPGKRIIELNANNTRRLSEVGVIGLIAHELAYLYLFKEKGITFEDILEKTVDMKEAEADTESLTDKWGYGEELEALKPSS